MSDTWSAFKERVGDLEALAAAMGVLEWDQQVMMPAAGAELRGSSMALLSRVYHERTVDPALGELVATLEQDADPVRQAAARVVGRRHRRATRVPGALVGAFAEAGSAGFAAWMRAREERSWASFAPALSRLVTLSREISSCHGPADHPYDHLLAEYDPGSTTAEVSAMFGRLAGELSGFVRALDGRPHPDEVQVPCTEQDTLDISRQVAAALGYRFDQGRLDVSQHPFTVGIGPGDVRITTHPYANDLAGTLWGTIHETGHALYEQGLPVELRGTGLREAASTGMHESQSRFWENFIGRSHAFAIWLAPLLNERFPGLNLSADALFRASNRVRPSFIRVHADEATYNLHILIRFELERDLVAGLIEVDELPDRWDAAYERLLGIRPPDLLQGVLQDVHWSSGLFGYFPSYTMGNLYAASLSQALRQAIPDLWERVGGGDFAPVLAWLREKIHARGKILDAPELLREAAGERDPVADFMANLYERQGRVYGIAG